MFAIDAANGVQNRHTTFNGIGMLRQSWRNAQARARAGVPQGKGALVVGPMLGQFTHHRPVVKSAGGGGLPLALGRPSPVPSLKEIIQFQYTKYLLKKHVTPKPDCHSESNLHVYSVYCNKFTL